MHTVKNLNERIAFISRNAVWAMNPDGSDMARLTTPVNALDAFPLTFSPRGEKIAFERFDARSYAPQIWVMNTDGTGLASLTPGAGYSDTYAWSPDGAKIAYVSDAKLYVASAGGTGRKRLTPSHKLVNAPSWSPDGREIAFVSARRGPDHHSVSQSQIYVINVASCRLRNLSNSAHADHDPAFSPNGEKVMFMRYPSTYSAWKGDLCVMSADGSEQHNLTQTLDAYNGSWSPDGRKIAFTRKHEQAIDVYLITLGNDHATERLTHGAEVHGVPAWSPDGTALAFSSELDIFVINADGSGLTNITNDPSGNNTFPAWAPAFQTASKAPMLACEDPR